MKSVLNRAVVAVAVLVSLGALGCSGHTADGISGPSGSSNVVGPGANANEALFDAPRGSATPDTIYGVWGGSRVNNGTTYDVRMQLSATAATIASRCTLGTGRSSGVVGVTVSARVSGESIQLLESKSDEKDDGGVRCFVKVTPREAKRCAADVHQGFERDCFTLESTTLIDYGTFPLDKLELTKLSD